MFIVYFGTKLSTLLICEISYGVND